MCHFRQRWLVMIIPVSIWITLLKENRLLFPTWLPMQPLLIGWWTCFRKDKSWFCVDCSSWSLCSVDKRTPHEPTYAFLPPPPLGKMSATSWWHTQPLKALWCCQGSTMQFRAKYQKSLDIRLDSGSTWLDGVNGILMQQEPNLSKQDYWNRSALLPLPTP
jgi:hypothetical protein